MEDERVKGLQLLDIQHTACRKLLYLDDAEDLRDLSLLPIHPGEVLQEDFMKPLGLSQYRLAHDIGVTPIRISQIVRGQRCDVWQIAWVNNRRGRVLPKIQIRLGSSISRSA